MADTSPRNDDRDQIIVLFANRYRNLPISTGFYSANGVAKAEPTATNMKGQNVGIITVAVGGSYLLQSLSSPQFSVHHLNSTTDPKHLAQEIIADMGRNIFQRVDHLPCSKSGNQL